MRTPHTHSVLSVREGHMCSYWLFFLIPWSSLWRKRTAIKWWTDSIFGPQVLPTGRTVDRKCPFFTACSWHLCGLWTCGFVSGAAALFRWSSHQFLGVLCCLDFYNLLGCFRADSVKVPSITLKVIRLNCVLHSGTHTVTCVLLQGLSMLRHKAADRTLPSASSPAATKQHRGAESRRTFPLMPLTKSQLQLEEGRNQDSPNTQDVRCGPFPPPSPTPSHFLRSAHADCSNKP